MKIREIDIKGVGGIQNLHLNFNDSMNILCGPNSVGKTTVLESIATMFIFSKPIVKRNVLCEYGEISSVLVVDKEEKKGKVEIKDFSPLGEKSVYALYDYGSKFLSLKVNRTFSYSSLFSIPSDPKRDNQMIWQEALNGIDYDGFKGWFVNRYLYSAREGTLSEQQLANYHLAEKCFSFVNSAYSFSRVMGSSNDIMVNTPQGEIYYEYLSAGFKSILSILFSIIKEIEFRFKEHQMTAEEFDGIILIDEVEVHLHPEWQEKILLVLRKTFPNAQFIVTTHSPHVIQTANPNEIIALSMDENNNVAVREDIYTSKYGFKGWTIEEILYDVMGMKTLRTALYQQMIEDFGKAIDEENIEKANTIYSELDQLLHPASPQRKLLQFQLAKIGES